jgi:hypothetical protein
MTDPELDNYATDVPEYADPDSSAEDTEIDYDRLDSPALPPDRGTGSSYGLEGFGTTSREQHEGESLAGRLARELPDVSADDRTFPDEDAVRVDEPTITRSGPVSTLDQDRDDLGRVGSHASPEEAALSVRSDEE